MSSSNSNNNNPNRTLNTTDMRQSESPARTIDSHDSTIGSLDTIVDRSLNREEMLQTPAIEQSVNTTNVQHHQNQHGSLTNSQIAMLQPNSGDEEIRDRHQQQHSTRQQPQQQQHSASTPTHSDAQSHIYSSPVYDQKPPLKLSAVTLLSAVSDAQVNNANNDNQKKPKLITHNEFQQQLQQANASRANTLDSRISKKQRLPAELIKIKDGGDGGDGGSSVRSSHLKASKSQRRREMSSASCCSAFPMQIVLGTLQLFLAISLVALGALLIVRDAALSMAGCGIWAGLFAAITGSLGVISIRKTQTAFLALSLICIASSTLALAISGVGLTRDIYRMEEKFDPLNASGEISAACGLIFALFLHFIVSIVSVYRCALQICGRLERNDLNDVIIKSKGSGIILDQEKIDQYIKAMSLTGSEKENSEKLGAMWMAAQLAAQMGTLPPPSVRKITPPSRPVMLIPARAGSTSMLAGPPAPMPPMALPPPMIYRGVPIHPMRPGPGPLMYAGYHPSTGSIPGSYRTSRSYGGEIQNQRRQRRRLATQLRSGKMDANKRQRRKSDADVLDGQAFQYTGLDRTIADSFLAQQAQSNAGSHVDYSSSSSASDMYGKGKIPSASSRASSKTKIICRDVVM